MVEQLQSPRVPIASAPRRKAETAAEDDSLNMLARPQLGRNTVSQPKARGRSCDPYQVQPQPAKKMQGWYQLPDGYMVLLPFDGLSASGGKASP